MSLEKHQNITEFFGGKCVFVTGASGFLGKVLLSKLLRSFQDINSIFILIRSKRGQSVSSRLDDLLTSPVSIYNLRHLLKSPQKVLRIIQYICKPDPYKKVNEASAL